MWQRWEVDISEFNQTCVVVLGTRLLKCPTVLLALILLFNLKSRSRGSFHVPLVLSLTASPPGMVIHTSYSPCLLCCSPQLSASVFSKSGLELHRQTVICISMCMGLLLQLLFYALCIRCSNCSFDQLIVLLW